MLSERSDSNTLTMLSGLDVAGMETPRDTRGYQQPRQPWQSSLEKVRGIDAAGAAAREQAAEVAAEQRQLHQQERDAARERHREEQRVASALARASIAAVAEASESETANRMQALRASQRQAAAEVAQQAREMAEDAMEEEAEMTQRRRETQGLTAGTRLRVSGLPPAVFADSEASPFGRLQRPLVTAAGGLSAASTTVVLKHLGDRLLAGQGGQAEEDLAVVPVFGTLAAAQGELCEALLAWAGEAEAAQQPEAVLGEILAGWQ